jgi:sulfite reductase (ferredoxin)
VPEVLDMITSRYSTEHQPNESFQDWITRLGKKEIRAMLEPYTHMPAYDEDNTLYTDWADTREYSLGDIGVGECAGEVVSLFAMEIAKSESEHFEALLAQEEGQNEKADQGAYRSMLLAARALIRSQYPDISNEPNKIVDEFRTRFVDTNLFQDRFAGATFANYFFKRHENPPATVDADHARRIVEEARLFIEAIYACELRVNGSIVS